MVLMLMYGSKIKCPTLSRGGYFLVVVPRILSKTF